jgi:uncharacterized protein
MVRTYITRSLEPVSQLIPVEVKESATPRPVFAASIQAFQKDIGSRTSDGYVVHPGEIRLPLGQNVTALPFAEL